MYVDISGRLETLCFTFSLFYFLHSNFFFLLMEVDQGRYQMHRAVHTTSAALALLPGKLSVLHKRHYFLLQRDLSCQSNSVVKYIPCLRKFFRPFNGSMNLKRSPIGM